MYLYGTDSFENGIHGNKAIIFLLLRMKTRRGIQESCITLKENFLRNLFLLICPDPQK